ncbi:radical activating enzyme [Thermodesulfovibrio sp. N1]|jgi:putative pyruvate formate lyase activating enzyme|uniref:radical SAM protein n=1 Tax=Thermodesulfovibrio sp. N1 TaxID=1871110 RepID=UPI000858B547|nr:radical SAM protein [Thermodesulfovibrio sp. N1]ODA44909.1 radical activating enzyme [Thermodesulfovibrio sp. N1]
MEKNCGDKISRRNFLKKISCIGLQMLFLPIFGRHGYGKSINSGFTPAYLKLHRSGELKERAEKLWKIMEKCQLCPRKCGVNRLKGMKGVCRAPGSKLVISAFHPHFGEERPLVGKRGSGTIFFTHCNLRCVFCQNWEISHIGRGTERSINDLADMMLFLQKIGCHNINLVTPTHYSPHILKALDVAVEKGLTLPLVYNTSGWERLEILKVLDGIVDIYLPDIKYWESSMSSKYSSGAETYPDITKEAVLEMHRQVGTAKPAKDGIIYRGLIIRHLVMPNNVAGSEKIMEWIAKVLPKDTYVNIMAQYTPLYKAFDYPEISRRITKEEYVKVVNKAKELGLSNLDIQGYWWLR